MSDQPNITCPKCNRISYHRGDIKHSYCNACGYHDSLENTVPGVPGISARWRQPTPAMQLQAVMGAFEGHFSNWVAGITPALDLRVEFRRTMEQVQDLSRHLEAGGWIHE